VNDDDPAATVAIEGGSPLWRRGMERVARSTGFVVVEAATAEVVLRAAASESSGHNEQRISEERASGRHRPTADAVDVGIQLEEAADARRVVISVRSVPRVAVLRGLLELVEELLGRRPEAR
jgi:hypothetical protein